MRYALVMAIAMVSLVACGPKAAGTATTDYRAFTEHYAFNITSDPSPPHAREKVVFKIRVRDKNSSQPIEGGEGIIYGNTEDGGGKTWDSFTPGQAPGTYTANLKFVVAQNWALALQFRKDSTQKLEKVDTWYQQVYPEQPATP
ncbi:MAG TPA: hypothetical protein VK511_04185 [Gemmatimonadaceae bacterium]|nr:hypothetical protein [Gemmatimonadaceae bacterium]